MSKSKINFWADMDSVTEEQIAQIQKHFSYDKVADVYRLIFKEGIKTIMNNNSINQKTISILQADEYITTAIGIIIENEFHQSKIVQLKDEKDLLNKSLPDLLIINQGSVTTKILKEFSAVKILLTYHGELKIDISNFSNITLLPSSFKAPDLALAVKKILG